MSEIRRNNDNHNKSTSRFIRLSLWARARMDGRSDVYSSPDYTEFENNPSFVVNELYALISAYNESKETSLIMFDTKTIVSAVLVRDFNTCLLEQELDFCSRILVEDLLKLLSPDSPFVPLLNSTIFSAVPFLFSFYDTNSDLKKRLYLFHVAVILLNNTNRFDLLKCFSYDMWKNHENDANIIVAILITVAECIEISYGNISINDALNKALSKKRVKINSIIKNADDVNISLPNLNINHQIIVLFLININNPNHFRLFLPYIENTISVIFSYSTGDIRQSEFDYYLAPEYIKWITNYVYFSCEPIRTRLIEFITHNIHTNSRYLSDFLTNIMFTHNKNKNNVVFWSIWNKLLPTMHSLCETRKIDVINRNYSFPSEFNDAISVYLFAWPYWGEKQVSWIGVDQSHFSFFEQVVDKFAYVPAVLYSFSRFLVTVGSMFQLDGLIWISDIVNRHEHLNLENLVDNTIEHLEKYVVQITSNALFKDEITKKGTYRESLLILLNFLVQNGSTTGFLIREKMY